MKDELGAKINTEFTVLRPKTYCYLKDHNDVKKDTKKVCHKTKS